MIFPFASYFHCLRLPPCCLHCKLLPVQYQEYKYGLGSLQMSLVTELAWLLGQILLSVQMGNFSPVNLDEIQETKTKTVPHKVVGNTCIQGKHCAILAAKLQKQSYSVEQVLPQLPKLESSYWIMQQSPTFNNRFLPPEHSCLLHSCSIG